MRLDERVVVVVPVLESRGVEFESLLQLLQKEVQCSERTSSIMGFDLSVCGVSVSDRPPKQ